MFSKTFSVTRWVSKKCSLRPSMSHFWCQGNDILDFVGYTVHLKEICSNAFVVALLVSMRLSRGPFMLNVWPPCGNVYYLLRYIFWSNKLYLEIVLLHVWSRRDLLLEVVCTTPGLKNVLQDLLYYNDGLKKMFSKTVPVRLLVSRRCSIRHLRLHNWSTNSRPPFPLHQWLQESIK